MAITPKRKPNKFPKGTKVAFFSCEEEECKCHKVAVGTFSGTISHVGRKYLTVEFPPDDDGPLVRELMVNREVSEKHLTPLGRKVVTRYKSNPEGDTT